VPIYDYVCTSCGHEVEVVHSVHGHGPSACPQCGGHMRKAIVAAAVHFKGSGWARKDRGAGRPSKPASDEAARPQAEAPAPSMGSGGTSGETSPKGAD
jgi:putative FmdB family regulatory protein